MSEQVCISEEYVHQLKWYYWPRLPLLPDYRFKKADEHNEWRFWIHWLIFRAWTSGSPGIGFEVKLDDQQLMIRLTLPYLYTGLFIPLFPWKWHQKLWRYPRPKWLKDPSGESGK